LSGSRDGTANRFMDRQDIVPVKQREMNVA